ncbi:MAG: hypothetical protein ACJAXN_000979 [Psychromonas sp.]|jgi:hypothetical protein
MEILAILLCLISQIGQSGLWIASGQFKIAPGKEE